MFICSKNKSNLRVQINNADTKQLILWERKREKIMNRNEKKRNPIANTNGCNEKREAIQQENVVT